MTSVLQPRECKVTKKPQKTYGFYLRVEKDTAGHLIRNVQKNSPAEEAGLKDGDRVLRVNGVFVDKQEHTQVLLCLAWDPHHSPITQTQCHYVKLSLPVFMTSSARKSKSQINCSEYLPTAFMTHNGHEMSLRCLHSA